MAGSKEQESFFKAIDSLEVETQPFNAENDKKSMMVTPSTGLLNTDYGDVGFVNYAYSEKRRQNYGEAGGVETYIPGMFKDGDFVPIIWRDVKDEVTTSVEEELENPGKVKFEPESYYFEGDVFKTNPEEQVFLRALNNYDVELNPAMAEDEEENGFMERPHLGVIKARGIDNYGYIERRKTFMNPDIEPAEQSTVEVLGMIEPDLSINPVEDVGTQSSLKVKMYSKVDSLTSKDDIKFRDELQEHED